MFLRQMIANNTLKFYVDQLHLSLFPKGMLNQRHRIPFLHLWN